ncbi:MAG: recombination protein RecR [Bacteroidales bacterium]|nr:recombination protein RecR [Bacteroidales bacterium]
MLRDNHSIKLLDEAVEAFSSLPGVGRKSALRLALHILNQPRESVDRFVKSISSLSKDIKYCPVCRMISDSGLCPFCGDKSRDSSIICVVESIRDVLSIENTSQYNGHYHILGGIISPMDGVGPNDLPIKELIDRIASGDVLEVVFALSTSMEGETTSFYLFKKLSQFPIKITTIARGVGFGDELEYTDELTLGRSILNRQLFKP